MENVTFFLVQSVIYFAYMNVIGHLTCNVEMLIHLNSTIIIDRLLLDIYSILIKFIFWEQWLILTALQFQSALFCHFFQAEDVQTKS